MDATMDNHEAIAQQFYVALDHGDWLAVAELTDPEWLRDFAEERLEYARTLERPPEPQAHAGPAGPADAPPEVRKWLAEHTTRAPGRSSLAEEFDGARSVAELDSLTPVQLAAKSLHGLFGRARDQVERTWLGVVHEGTEQAHAVYRARFLLAADDEGSVGILSMRRTPAGWRVLWDGHGPFGLPGFGGHMYMVGRVAQSADPSA